MSDLDDATVAPYVPTRRVKAMMGEVIILGAEIDHLISLALFKLLQLDFSAGFPLMDKSMIGTKLAKLRYFIETTDDDDFCARFKEIDSFLEAFLALRNTFAHGVIMGKRVPKGEPEAVMFLMTANYTDNEGSFCHIVKNSTEEMMRDAIKDGKVGIERIKQLFGVKPLHETVPYKVLGKRPQTLKSRRRGDPSKDRPPPQSSPP